MSTERILNVPVITRETTEFPAGGASVRVAAGVTEVNGLDHGDISGRGVVVVVFDTTNYDLQRVIRPESGTSQADASLSRPVKKTEPQAQSSNRMVDVMNA